MSCLGSLGGAVIPTVEGSGGSLTSGVEYGPAITTDGEFQLMYVRHFLREAGERMIREGPQEGNYNDLVG